MIKFLVGAMFGFIFGWLWWSQRRSQTNSNQYNRQAVTGDAEVAARTAERAEFNRLKAELEVCEQRTRALRQTVDSQATELRTLKRQLDSTGSSSKGTDIAPGELQSLQNEQAALRSQLSERDELNKDLQARLQAAQEAAASDTSYATEISGLSEELDNKNAALIDMDAQLKSLQVKLDERSAQLLELEQKAAAADEQNTQLQDLQNQLNDLRGENEQIIAERDRAVADLQNRLEEMDATANVTSELEQLQMELADSNERAHTLQNELDGKNAALADQEEQQRLLQARLEENAGQLQELENQTMVIEMQKAQLQDLQDQLDEALQQQTRSPSPEQGSLEETIPAAADAGEEEEIDIEALKASLPKATTDRDNLKRIKGIASVIEGLLNDLGITTFRQITLLDESQINQVARALKTFPDRIHRDNWIEQARDLHKKKYNEDI